MILALLYGCVLMFIIYQLAEVKQNRYTKLLASFMTLLIILQVLFSVNYWVEAAAILALAVIGPIILVISLILSFFSSRKSPVIKSDLDIKRKLAHMIVLLIFVKPLVQYISDISYPGLVSILGEPPSTFRMDSLYPVFALEIFFLALPLIMVILEFLRLKVGIIHLPSLRQRELNDLATYFYTCLSATFVFLMFRLEVALAAIVAAILGDSAGCIVGKLFGKTRIRDKTVEGTIAEFIVASIVAYPFVGIYSLIGATVISIVDIISLPLDDNLYFPPLFALGVIWAF